MDAEGRADLGRRGGKHSSPTIAGATTKENFFMGCARGRRGMMIACPLLSDDGHLKLKHTTISHQSSNQPPNWRPSESSQCYHHPTMMFACARGVAAKDGFDGAQDKRCMLQYSCDKIIELIIICCHLQLHTPAVQ